MMLDIQPSIDDGLYIAIALIDFFQAVSEVEKNVQSHVAFSDITTFICDFCPVLEDNKGDTNLNKRIIPKKKQFNRKTDQRELRDIDVQPPKVIKDNNATLRRLLKENLKIDSVHHNNNLIVQSFFIEKIQKFVILDSFSENIMIYNTDCTLNSKIIPKTQSVKGQVILDVAFSDRQNRIGVTFRDQYLVFYELKNLQSGYEKVIYAGQHAEIRDDQSKIWYFNHLDAWVTCNRSQKQLFWWNLEDETIYKQIPETMSTNSINRKQQYVNNVFEKGIIDCKEIDYLKLVAISVKDKTLVLWDFISNQMYLKFDTNHSHLHSIIFIQEYQQIVTAGYENDINIYHILYNSPDYQHTGILQGHSSLVTAVANVEGTPMIISADDRFNVKTWDIRNQSCIQTISLDLRSPIRQMHCINDKVCFVSSRISTIEFDMDNILTKEQLEDVVPLAINYDIHNQELQVTTKYDSRIINIQNGRIKSVMGGLIQKAEDELTTFCMYQQNKKFLTGNIQGKIQLYNVKGCEQVSEIEAHQDQIINMKVDYKNRLIVTSSADACIAVHQIVGDQFKKIRQAINLHDCKEVSFMELSVYHNLIVTAYHESNIVVFWHYEYLRINVILEFSQDEYIQQMEIINGHGVLIVSTNKYMIYFIHFKTINENLQLSLVGSINLLQNIENNKEYIIQKQQREDKQNKLNPLRKQNKEKERSDFIDWKNKQLDILEENIRQAKEEENKLKQYKLYQDQVKNSPQKAQKRSSTIPNQPTSIIGSLIQETIKNSTNGNNNINMSTTSFSNLNNLNVNNNNSSQIIMDSSITFNNNNNESDKKILSLQKIDSNVLNNTSTTNFGGGESVTKKAKVKFLNKKKANHNNFSVNASNIQGLNLQETQNKIEMLEKEFQKLQNQQYVDQEELQYLEKMSVSKLKVYIQYRQQSDSKSQDLSLYQAFLLVGFNNGQLRNYQITSLLNQDLLTPKNNKMKKPNTNSYRMGQEDYKKMMEQQSQTVYIMENNVLRLQNQNEGVGGNKKSGKKIKLQKMDQSQQGGDTSVSNINNNNNNNNFNNSNFNYYNLNNNQNILENSIFQSSEKKTTYDQLMELYDLVPKNMQKTNKINLQVFILEAHKDQISGIEIISVNGFSVITFSKDKYIKIWSYPQLNLLCKLNIQHPLPIKWDIVVDQTFHYREKIYFAMKSLKFCIEKYKNILTIGQAQQFNMEYFIKGFIQKENENLSIEENQEKVQKVEKNESKFKKVSNIEVIQRNTYKNNLSENSDDENEKIQNNQEIQDKVPVMQDFYEPRDIAFEKAKDIYENEIAGPSLKHMHEVKRARDVKQSIIDIEKANKQKESYRQKVQKIQEQEKEEDKLFTQLQTMLHPDKQYRLYPDDRNRMMDQHQMEYNKDYQKIKGTFETIDSTSIQKYKQSTQISDKSLLKKNINFNKSPKSGGGVKQYDKFDSPYQTSNKKNQQQQNKQKNLLSTHEQHSNNHVDSQFLQSIGSHTVLPYEGSSMLQKQSGRNQRSHSNFLSTDKKKLQNKQQQQSNLQDKMNTFEVYAQQKSYIDENELQQSHKQIKKAISQQKGFKGIMKNIKSFIGNNIQEREQSRKGFNNILKQMDLKVKLSSRNNLNAYGESSEFGRSKRSHTTQTKQSQGNFSSQYNINIGNYQESSIGNMLKTKECSFFKEMSTNQQENSINYNNTNTNNNNLLQTNINNNIQSTGVKSKRSFSSQQYQTQLNSQYNNQNYVNNNKNSNQFNQDDFQQNYLNSQNKQIDSQKKQGMNQHIRQELYVQSKLEMENKIIKLNDKNQINNNVKPTFNSGQKKNNKLLPLNSSNKKKTMLQNQNINLQQLIEKNINQN